MIHFFSEKKNNQNSNQSSYNLSFIFLLILIILFISFPLLRYYSLNARVADFGFYLVELNAISKGEYWRAFHDHINLISILYSLFQIIFKSNFPFVLLLVQSLCLLSPLYIYRRFHIKYLLFYVLFPPIWYINLNDFHYETLAFPLLLLLLNLIDKKSNYFFINLFLLFCIKESYIVLGLFITIFAYVKNRDILSLLYFLISLLIFYLSFYFLMPGFHQEKEVSDTINYLQNSEVSNNLILKKLLLIYFLFFYFSFNFKKNYVYLINIFPYLFIVFFLTNNSNYISFTNHYFLLAIPFVIYLYFKNDFINEHSNLIIYKMSSYLRILSIIIFLPLPGSLIYFTKFSNHDLISYIKDIKQTRVINSFLNDMKTDGSFDNKFIVSQNNFFHSSFVDAKYISPLNSDNSYKLAHYNGFNRINLLIKSPDFIFYTYERDCFIDDKKCKFLDLNHLNAYETLYKDKNFVLLKKNQ